MNSIYKIVFNKATGTYQAVCEYARSQGKGAGGQVGSVGSSRFDALTGKVFAFSALALGVFLVTHPALAESVDENQLPADITKLHSLQFADGQGIKIGDANTKAQYSESLALGREAKAEYNVGAIAIGTNAATSYISKDNIIQGNVFHANYNNPYSEFNLGKDPKSLRNRVTDEGKRTPTGVNYKNDVGSAAIAIGRNSIGGNGGVALGDGAQALVDLKNRNRGLGVAIGSYALSRGGGVVVGSSAEAVGINSVAFGRQAVAKGGASQAYGASSSAVGEKSLALGHSAESIGARSITIGGSSGNSVEKYDAKTNTKAEADDSIAIGARARTVGERSYQAIAIGKNAEASGVSATTIGASSQASDHFSQALGANAEATKFGAQAFGLLASAKERNAIAIGTGTKALGKNSQALGTKAESRGERSLAAGFEAQTAKNAANALALGSKANASVANGVALGAGSVADRDRFTQPAVATHTATFARGEVYTPISDAVVGDATGSTVALTKHRTDVAATAANTKAAVSVGGNGITRQITNLAAGSEDSDAVNVAQLKSLAAMPMIFQADDGRQVERKLGERLPIKGATNGGIITKADLASNGLTIEVKPDMAKGIKIDENGVGINVNQQGPLTVDDQGLSLKINGEILEITGAEGNKKLSAKAPNFFADTGNATTKDSAVEFDGEKNKLGVVGGQTIVGGQQAQKGKNIETKIDKANNKIEVALKTDVTELTSLQFADGKGIKIGDGETKATHNDMIAIGKGATVTEGSVGDIGLGLRKALGFNEQLSGMPTGNHDQYGAYYLTSQGLAVGNQAYSGKFATSLGGRAKAAGMYSTAIGTNAYGASEGTVALGAGSFATGRSGVAIGREAVSTGNFAQALGSVSSATGEKSFAVGHSATASGNRGIAIGASSNKSGTLYQKYDESGKTTTYGAQALGQDSIALGSGSVAEQTNTLAIGRGAQATVADGVALGSGSKADRSGFEQLNNVTPDAAAAFAANQVYTPISDELLEQARDAIEGYNNTIKQTIKGGKGAVSVGDNANTRQIINLAAGSEDTDAVNVAQLKALAGMPMMFEADKNKDGQDVNGKVVKRKMGEQLSIKGKADSGVVTKVNATENGIDIAVKAGDGIEVNATGVNVKPKDKGALTVDGNGIAVNVNNQKGIEIGTDNKLAVKADTTKGIKVDGDGIGINLKAGDNPLHFDDQGALTFNAQNVVEQAQLPVVYTDKAGNKLTKVGDEFYQVINGGRARVATPKEQVIASMNNGNGETKQAPMTLANVQSSINLKQPLGNGPQVTADKPADFDTIKNNAATVEDAMKVGFNLKNNNQAKDFVQAFDTLNVVDGNGTMAIVETDGQGKVSTIKVDVKAKHNGGLSIDDRGVSVDVDNKTIQLTTDGKVAAKTTELNTNPQGGDEAGKVTVEGNQGDALVTAKTVADAINASGFTVQANGKDGKLVKAGDKVNFVNGDLTTVTLEAGEDGQNNVKVDVNAQGLVENAQLPVVYTDKAGNKLAKTADGKFVRVNPLTGKPLTNGNNEIDPNEVIASLNNGNNSVQEPMTLNNLKHNIQPQPVLDNKLTHANKPVFDERSLTNAATVGDVLNAGFNLRQDGAVKDFVQAFDAIDFVKGNATSVEIETNDDQTQSKVKININTDNKTIEVKDGQVSAKITKLNTNPQGGDEAGKVTVEGNQGDALVTAQTVADAINNSGFTLATSQSGTGQAVGESELIKTGEKVIIDAGDNMSVTQAGGRVSIATKDDVVFKHVLADDIMAKNSLTVGDTTDGRKAVKITSTGKAGSEKNIITGLSDTLPRPAGTATQQVISTDLDISSAQADNAKLSRAATVADALSTGFNLQENGVAKDFVKAYDTVNFVDSDSVQTKVATDKDGKISRISNEIKVNPNQGLERTQAGVGIKLKPSAGNPLNVNEYGLGLDYDVDKLAVKDRILTVNTTDLFVSDDPDNADGNTGRVQLDDPAKGKALVTAQGVADAINESGFLLKAEDETVKLVSPGDSVNIKAEKTDQGNGNIRVFENNGDIVIGTADDVNFNTVQVEEELKVGDVKIDQDGINAGNKQITNVKEGEKDTDAVNVKQLKDSATKYFADTDFDESQTAATSKDKAKAAKDNVIGIKGGVTGDENQDGASNITTKLISDDNTLEVTLNPVLKGLKSIQFAKDQGITMGDTRTLASNPTATAIGRGANATAFGAQAFGRDAMANADYANALGNRAIATAQGAQAMGAFSSADADFAQALGMAAIANKEGALALGAAAEAKTTGGVALGALSVADRAAIVGATTSRTANATNQVYSPTQNEELSTAITVTVKGNLGAVSVGDKNNTRQITNVAAGSSDTDAANIAQLKAVAELPFTVEADQGGKATVKLGDNLPVKGKEKSGITTSVNAIKDGIDIAVKAGNGIEVDATGVKVKPKDQGALTVDGNGIAVNVNNQKGIEIGTDNKLAVKADTTKGIKVDGNGIGINLKAGDNPLHFDDQGALTFNAQNVVEQAQLPVVYTDKAGNKLTKVGDKFYQVNPLNGNPTRQEVAPNEVIASMNNGLGQTQNAPMTLANVAHNITPNKDLGSEVISYANKPTRLQENNAATVGDVLNAGFNLKQRGNNKDFVQAFDTLDIIDGAGTTAQVTTDDKHQVNQITFNVKADHQTGIKVTDEGVGINIDENAGLEFKPMTDKSASKLAVKADGTTIKVENNTVKAKTTELNTNPQGGDEAGKVTVEGNQGDALVTAQTVANAINDSGFTLATSQSGTGQAVGESELIKTGEKVIIDAGDNMSVTQAGGRVSIATKDDVVFKHVLADDIMAKNSLTVGDTTDGRKAVKITSTGKAGSEKNIITGLSDTLPRPAGTATQQVISTDLDISSAQADNAKLSRAATVADALSTGFNLQENGVAKDFVKAYDTVNFVDSDSVQTKVATDKDGKISRISNEIKVNPNQGLERTQAGVGIKLKPSAGNPLNVNEYGLGLDYDVDKLAVKDRILTVNTTDLFVSDDPDNADGNTGRVQLDDPAKGKALVTAQGVADAINESGFLLKAEDETVKLVSPGDSVNIKAEKTDQGNGNIRVFENNGDIVIGTADDVNFNTVQVEEELKVGDVKIDQDGINAGNKQITNVKEGEKDTDAVNVKQLKDSATKYFADTDFDESQTAATSKDKAKAAKDNVIGIKGGVTGDENQDGASNITTKLISDDNTLEVTLNPVLKGLKSIQFAKDQGITMGDTRTLASNPTATAIGRGANATAFGAQAFGRDAMANADYANALGNRAIATAQGAQAMGAFSSADADFAQALGMAAIANKEGALALGAAAEAKTTGGVALGALSVADRAAIVGATTSRTANATNQVYSPTQNEELSTAITVTVKGNLGAVSVGDKNNTRQITNVAAGSSDTDAANIAQLKAVAELPFTVEADQGGKATVKLGDNLPVKGKEKSGITTSVNAIKDGIDIAVKAGNGIEVDATGVKVKPKDQGALTVDGNGIAVNVNNQKGIEIGTDNKLAVKADTTKGIKVDGNGIGINLKAGDNPLHFDDQGALTFNAQNVVEQAQLPVVYTDKAGNKLAKVGDKFYQVNPLNGNPTRQEVAPNEVIASMNNGLGQTQNAPMTLANVAHNITPNKDLGSEVISYANKPTRLQENNAATVGDVLNAGFNLKQRGNNKDFVQAFDTLDIIDGAGTTAQVTTDDKHQVNQITFNVKADHQTGIKVTDEGVGINIDENAGLEFKPMTDKSASKLAVKADGTTIKVENNTVKAKTTELNTNPQGGDEAGKVTVEGNQGDALVTAQTVANAINDSGFTLATSQSGTGQAVGESELIKTGEKVIIDAGDNMSVTQAGGRVSIATKDDVVFKHVLADDIMAKNSLTVGDTTDGRKAVKITSTGKAGSEKNIITGLSDTLPRPAGTATQQVISTDLDISSAQADNAKLSRAATVADALSTGFNLQENGVAKDFVKAYDTVNFVDSDSVQTKVATDKDGKISRISNEIKVNPNQGLERTQAGVGIKLKPSAGNPLNVNEYGLGLDYDVDKLAVKDRILTVNTTDLFVSDDPDNADGNTGRVQLDDPAKGKALVTAQGVADAINESGFLLKAEDETVKLVSPGDSVNIKAEKTDQGNGNIRVFENNGDIVIGTADDVNFNTVQVEEELKVGDVKIDQDGINAGNKQITNVKEGEKDTDAVNVKQLKDSATKYFADTDFDESQTAATSKDKAKAAKDNVIGIKGGVTGDENQDGASNITTKLISDDNTLEVTLNPVLKGLKSIQFAKDQGITMGDTRTLASNPTATAIGRGANATAFGAQAFGRDAMANADYANALGNRAIATAQGAQAMGAFSSADADFAQALGMAAIANKEGALALGAAAEAKTTGGVALGALSVADRAAIVGATTSRTANATNQVYSPTQTKS
ncbi:ESPR-type extended signal peptide-containing protein [Moraxella bovoculi]|uniref:ESPR-type extended signal peptide-containing protein n=1 Tax=Moraxella bovoculi TaxID=386891 RepID=UPI00072F4079|nr:ESPR-type extended signal peptide-containing protein [Moraxella bovoculi]AKG15062.2 hypothetical protein AAX08_02780 [Moraxella bovoculi]